MWDPYNWSDDRPKLRESNDMERKPYYVLRLKNSKFILHEGIGRVVYPYNGNAIQIYLTDSEAKKYDYIKVNKLLEPYYEILEHRCMTMPPELIFWAIEEVIFGNENTVN